MLKAERTLRGGGFFADVDYLQRRQSIVIMCVVEATLARMRYMIKSNTVGEKHLSPSTHGNRQAKKAQCPMESGLKSYSLRCPCIENRSSGNWLPNWDRYLC